MMQSSIHFPPFRQGRSVRQTEAVGTPVPPRQPAPQQGSPATFQPHQRQGPSLCPPGSPGCSGSPWGLPASRQGRFHSSRAPLGQRGSFIPPV